MLTSLRRLSKTKLGMLMIAFPFMMIIGGFIVADIQSFGTGSGGFGSGSDSLVTVGDEKVTDADIREAMQRRLEEVRKENPDADYSALAGDFDLLMRTLIDQRTLLAFAKNSDFILSKRLVDAEIAQLPAAQGLNGKFNEQAYQAFLAQRRMTDAQVRQIIRGGLLERLMLTPAVSNARASVGMATPYASMLLEAREGEAVAVPIEAFSPGLEPTDAQVNQFYEANRQRYVFPEQRVLRFARLGADSVASVQATPEEIANYYKANAAQYAAKESRDLSQVVVSDRKAAEAIAARAKSGTPLAQAATAVAGAGAAVSSLTNQSSDAYSGIAGAQAARSVFGAADGAIVGPFQSEFGWTVVRVDSISRIGGRSLEAVRGEIAAKISAEKRQAALEEQADAVQNAIDDGATFAEAAQAAKLSASETPLVKADGTSLTNRGFKLPAELAPALRAGFEIAANDPPEIVALADNAGYILVAPGEIVSAAPPALASIRTQVIVDWVKAEALKKAKAVADAIAAKAVGKTSLAEAVRASGANLPPIRPLAARRIQVVTAETPPPPAFQALFQLVSGKTRVVGDPDSRGFAVVKVNKIVPGNAMLQPGLIARMQTDLQRATSEAYAQQFVAAAAREVGVKRNDKAIAEARKRIISPTP